MRRHRPTSTSRGRHSLEATRPRTRRRVALVAAPLVTLLAIGTGLAAGDATPAKVDAANTDGGIAQGSLRAATVQLPRKAPSTRTLGTSRSMNRVPLVNHRRPEAKAKKWATEDLKLRVEPRAKSRTVGHVEAGKRVVLTGRHQGEFAEVVLKELPRWVTAQYLSKRKPAAAVPGGLSNAPCPDGSSIESAIQPAAVRVYRAVCAAFPELTAYGGQDGHGEHVNGEAIDFMVPSSPVGERVKDFLYAHHSELGLFDIIWSQQIWTIQRAGEGFRPMSDRGSATANHFDHVHIKIN